MLTGTLQGSVKRGPTLMIGRWRKLTRHRRIMLAIIMITLIVGPYVGLFFIEVSLESSSVEVGTGLFRHSLGTPLPTLRGEVAVTSLDQEVFVIGGADSSFSTSDKVEAYDTVSGSWRTIAPLPIALHHVAAVAYDGKIYVIGGFQGVPFAPTNTLFIFDTKTQTWSEGKSMPTARGALTAQVVKGRIYAIGGASGDALAINEAYDPATNTWEARSPMSTPREHLASAVVKDRIYVIGGRAVYPSAFTNLNDNEVYDPEKDTWTFAKSMPTKRGGIAAASLGDRIYVFGGETLTHTIDRDEEYNPDTDSWIERDPLKTGRHGFGAAAVGGSIYVIGGATSPHALSTLTLTSYVEIFTI